MSLKFIILQFISLAVLLGFIYGLVKLNLQVKQRRCLAQVWTKILFSFGSSMPKTFKVTVTPVGNTPLSGEIRRRHYHWIFPGRIEIVPLQKEQTFDRGYWDTIFWVEIKPDNEVEVRIET